MDKKTAEMVTVKTRQDGSVAVTGGCDLKSSQAYPPAFGRAMVKLHKRHLRDMRADQARRMAEVSKQPADLANFLAQNLSGKAMWSESSVHESLAYLLAG